jgi:hypothetical protein
MHQARKPAPKQTVNQKQDSSQWKEQETRLDDGLRKDWSRRNSAFTPSSREQEAKAWAHMVEPMFVTPPPLEFQPHAEKAQAYTMQAEKVWTSETAAWATEGSELRHLQPLSDAYGLELGPVPPLPYGPTPPLPPVLVGGTLPFGVSEPPGLSSVMCTRTTEWMTR